jgi:hypothetical protein
VTSNPLETTGTSIAPAVALHKGTYYWGVVPIDAEGNKGTPSATYSFAWQWPFSAPKHPVVTNLSKAEGTYIPQFSWSAVAGAATYEVEINSDKTWAAGSRVCCDDKVLQTTFSPTIALKSNRYYWRVRAIDSQGNAGDWSPGGDASDAGADTFVKTFDNRGQASIGGLHVEDWTGSTITGQRTTNPIVVWEPVPGAASYEYEVTLSTPNGCDYTYRGNPSDHWRGVTAATSWTPVAGGQTPFPPYPVPGKYPLADGHELTPNTSYCVRVRAYAGNDSQGNPVYGDYTELSSAFSFSGYGTQPWGQLGHGSCLSPGSPQAVAQMPCFRWQPVTWAQSYWIIVSKDQSFTNIVDYALTNIPAYAPRNAYNAVTYPDETTSYYWAVLPAPFKDGSGAVGSPLNALISGSFQKQIAPAGLAVQEPGHPVFTWNSVPGAFQYEFQASIDPNFGSTLEDVKTAETSYSAEATYPASAVAHTQGCTANSTKLSCLLPLHWRVRAIDVNGVALSWTQPAPFPHPLPQPNPISTQPVGAAIPTWRWRPVEGAASYDVHVDGPAGTRLDYHVIGTAVTPYTMVGTGVFRWQVRANFPNSVGGASGPYFRPGKPFAHTVNAPKGLRTSGSAAALVLSWQPVPGAARYQIQIGTKADFSSTVESVQTDGPTFAPRFPFGYGNGGKFYWRVAALDGNNASGDYSDTQTFKLPAHKYQ